MPVAALLLTLHVRFSRAGALAGRRLVLAGAAALLLGRPDGAAQAAAACGAGDGHPARITVVVADTSAPYQEVVDGIRSRLRSMEPEPLLRVVEAREYESARRDEVCAIVAVGLKAAQRLAASPGGPPILATLLPRESFHGLFGPQPGDAVSAIYIDQPLARQLALVRIALPGKRRIGMLVSSQTAPLLAELVASARPEEFHVVSERVDGTDTLYPALTRLLEGSDVLLALPDAQIYNPSTAQNILVATYRRQIPMVAFSASYVKAGALVALHTRPRQFGEQAGEVLRAMAQGNRWVLPPPQYPRYFSVSVNLQVARSLDLRVDDEQQLAQRLREAGAP